MGDAKNVFRIASYATENKQTGQIIEVALWNDELELRASIVTIATDECVMTLSIHDLPGLILSLKSIMGKINL